MRSSATGRPTNLALAFLLVSAILSGLASNTIGIDWALDLAMVHGVLAFAILALSPWKSMIIRHGLRRKRRGSWTSLTLLSLVLVTIGSGLFHAVGGKRIGPLTVMQVHIGAAVLALGFAVQHFIRHPVVPKVPDLNRRALLRGSVLAGGAAAIWTGNQQLIRALDLKGADRRFTGSHEVGSKSPALLPVTSWLDDRTPVVNEATYRFRIGDSELSLADLADQPRESFEAILDCTGGWYSTQVWEGIRLDRLIDPAEFRSFEVRSLTGYARRFPMRDVTKTYLVQRLGAQSLDPSHGYPLRVVAPGRRGFWWVKWVASIRPSMTPWWIQSPFPWT